MWKEDIDFRARREKISYVFCKILTDYLECTELEKKLFFYPGGKGWKWSQNKTLMKKLRKIFEKENNNFINDPNYMLSLSDISTNPYPKKYL